MASAPALRHQATQRRHPFQKVFIGPPWSPQASNLMLTQGIQGTWEYDFLLWNPRGLGIKLSASLVQHTLDYILTEQFRKKKKIVIISNVLFISSLYHSFTATRGTNWALVANICPCMYFGALLPYYLSFYPLLSDNELTLIDCMPMRTYSHLSANRQLCTISISCHYDAATVLQRFPVLWSAKINYPQLNY